MNSLEILFYSFLFAFNRLYDLVIWPMLSVRLIESPTYAFDEVENVGIHILDPPNMTATKIVHESNLHLRFLIITLAVIAIAYLFKIIMHSELSKESVCTRDASHAITGPETNFCDFDLQDDISNYYSSISLNFNGSSTRVQTFSNQPTDLLIWDRKMFNPL
ncbi:unnamed protein product [Kluyveromyces dobzhanskii CBS 2104]|uniref:WGS project CCBQ000000000 data, contig 00058 n=1 Tax=Kluyveromyces dobzhanskii CBS 2104 TaxID=1427455 RepID=A0A0A8LD93_9SACH|nr:unnamed protein product [Kluyveromyces dobzhanskii CBS 2104]